MATYRTIDGTGNNSNDTTLGSTGDQLLRITAADYADGISQLAGANRPGARQISNEVFAQSTTTGNAYDYSSFLWIWGQFLDHDITLTPSDPAAGLAPIAVPLSDPYFDPDGTGTQTIDFTRSGFDPATGTTGPRQYANSITAFIDASNVYGSDAVRAAALRDAGGYLKTSDGDLLPFNTDGLPNDPSPDPSFFLAGDVRASENVALTAMHTLFVREHNRLVDKFKLSQPAWDDETLYQEAKKVVEAQMQAITFNEFLPRLIGKDALSDYQGYRADVDPQISVIFSTAAYRFGHTMLSSTVQRLDEDGAESSFGHLALRDAFFRPDRLVNEGGIDDILRGAGVEEGEDIDTNIVDDVRNFLFGPPGAGGFDLAALNIQRGRDHGLTDYNSAREAYGLARVTSFAQITSDADLQNSLQELFGTVDNIDVFVGGLAEDHVPGALVGELFRAVLADQFTRLRDGDSFWYETRLSVDELATVSNATLADIIERNSGIGHMQDDVFKSYLRLGGSDGDDFLAGSESNDLLIGKAGDDTLIGNGGDDQLMGDAGADLAFGGAGNDTIYGGSQDDQLHGEEGRDRIMGEAGNDFLAGGKNDDVLFGGDGNDVLSGGSGSDTLEGGKGHDFLEGVFGNDTLLGGFGADRLSGDAGNDKLYGNQGNDHLFGGDGDDFIHGGNDNDVLDGGAGADILKGAYGHDHYHVDNAGDAITEQAGKGSDTVFASIGFALRDHSQYLEKLVLTGSGNISGTGNGLNNIITGNAGDNILNGAFGDDTLIGGLGDDLFKDDGGADTMIGGGGHDEYRVDERGDVVVEQAHSGIDLVASVISYSLRDAGKFLENLTLGGSADINGTGNSLKNTITGNSGANILNGAFGDDVLWGRMGNDIFDDDAGNDTMTGGGGADTFVFTNGFGADTITDFSSNNAEDIDLRAVTSITDFTDLVTSHLVDNGGTAQIVDGANTILLTGIAVADVGVGQLISGNDFIF